MAWTRVALIIMSRGFTGVGKWRHFRGCLGGVCGT
jgi:hypothetical protein